MPNNIKTSNNLAKVLVLLLLLLLNTNTNASYARRSPPVQVQSINANGIKIHPVYDNLDDELKVSVVGEKADHTSWKTLIYTVKYQQDLETDVQMVFLTSIQLANGILTVRDERGNTYSVDTKTGNLLNGPAKVLQGTLN